MSNAFPELDIYFPEAAESSMAEEMKERAGGLWQWNTDSPVGRPLEDGQYFFHRNGDDLAPACTLCISRKTPGHLFVPCVTPDANGGIPPDQVACIIQEFDEQIAEPAAQALGGRTSIGTNIHTLEDYFSRESIGLLEDFCSSANANDLGNHPLDRKRWMEFLLDVFRNENEKVVGDVFGKLLREKNWWPDSDIPRRVREYDFAMRLLELAEN